MRQKDFWGAEKRDAQSQRKRNKTKRSKIHQKESRRQIRQPVYEKKKRKKKRCCSTEYSNCFLPSFVHFWEIETSISFSLRQHCLNDDFFFLMLLSQSYARQRRPFEKWKTKYWKRIFFRPSPRIPRMGVPLLRSKWSAGWWNN